MQDKVYQAPSSLTIQAGASVTIHGSTEESKFKVAESYDGTVNQYGNVAPARAAVDVVFRKSRRLRA